MAFASFSYEAMVEHLHLLGVERGMQVVVHSSLISFGKLPERAKTVLDAFQYVLGSKGGIAVPTFTFGIDPTQPFSLQNTIPRGVGAFSAFIWQQPGVIRTPSCIHSYSMLGSIGDQISGVRHDTSFGTGSFFDLAVQRDFYWVMLGCEINFGCTLIHHSESVANVPYRHWIELPRCIELPDGSIKNFNYHYFARNSNNFVQNFDALKMQMASEDKLKVVSAPYGYSLAGSSSQIHAAALNMLKSNPYALVSPSNEYD